MLWILFSLLRVILALQSQRSADYRAVPDDSLITVLTHAHR